MIQDKWFKIKWSKEYKREKLGKQRENQIRWCVLMGWWQVDDKEEGVLYVRKRTRRVFLDNRSRCPAGEKETLWKFVEVDVGHRWLLEGPENDPSSAVSTLARNSGVLSSPWECLTPMEGQGMRGWWFCFLLPVTRERKRENLLYTLAFCTLFLARMVNTLLTGAALRSCIVLSPLPSSWSNSSSSSWLLSTLLSASARFLPSFLSTFSRHSFFSLEGSPSLLSFYLLVLLGVRIVVGHSQLYEMVLLSVEIIVSPSVFFFFFFLISIVFIGRIRGKY